MVDKLKVFISSAMTELHDARVTVQRALTDAGFEVIWFEGFGAQPAPPDSAYIEGVKGANIYVGIFWNQHSLPTEQEYHVALDENKPCFIYVRETGGKRDPNLQKLIDEEFKKRHTYKTFGELSTFITQVVSDTQTWMKSEWEKASKELLLAKARQKQLAAEKEAALLEKKEVEERVAKLQAEVEQLKRWSHEPLPVVQLQPVDVLAAEIGAMLEASGYTIEEKHTEGTRHIWLFCERRIGLLFEKSLFACVDDEIGLNDVQYVANTVARESLSTGYVISQQRVSQTAREIAVESTNIAAYSQGEFYQQLVDFSKYSEWLQTDYAASDIPKYYVNLACTKEQFDDAGNPIGRDRYDSMDEYIDQWLDERGKNHISILGDFGMGKTWFCQYYAHCRLQKYLADPTHQRLPILVTLREYTKSADIRQLVTDLLINQYNVQMMGGYRVFEEMNRQGKFLLIFDGFDEMAQKVDYQTVVDNFWELAKVVVPNSKVLLTSRTPYFRYTQEASKVLGGEELGRAMTRAIERPKFEVVYIEELTEDKTRAVLEKRVGAEQAVKYWEQIKTTYDLPSLARMPVMIEIILDALTEIEEGESVDPAKLYRISTGKWLDKNIAEARTFVDKWDKLFFMTELAWEMLSTGRLKVHYKELPERINRYFHIEKEDEKAYYDYDLRTQSFLKRDTNGYYEFAHKSLMEYFAALKFVLELGIPKPDFIKEIPVAKPPVPAVFERLVETFGARPLLPEVRVFIRYMVYDTEKLWDVIDATKGKTFGEVKYIGSNAATVLNDMRQSFANRDLSRAVLMAADLEGADLTGAKCAWANFEQANLTNAILKDADLTGANLRDARRVQTAAELVEITPLSRLGGAALANVPEYISQRFVNREHELDVIFRTIEEARATSGRIVEITGSAGMGKTWLLMHLRENLARIENKTVSAFIDLAQFHTQDQSDELIRSVIGQFADQVSISNVLLEATRTGCSNLAPVLFESIESMIKIGYAVIVIIDSVDTIQRQMFSWLEDIIQKLVGYNGVVVITAGRQRLDWRSFAIRRIVRSILLSALPVQATIEMLKGLYSASVAKAMHEYTGGHPLTTSWLSALLEKLRTDPQTQLDAEFVEKNRLVIAQTLDELIDTLFLRSVHPELRAILRVISTLRLFNLNSVQEFTMRFVNPDYDQKPQLSAIETLRDIVETGLVMWPGSGQLGYVMEPTLRRTMNKVLFVTNVRTFTERHRFAQEMYVQWAKNLAGDFQRMSIQEYLYHLANVLHAEDQEQAKFTQRFVAGFRDIFELRSSLEEGNRILAEMLLAEGLKQDKELWSIVPEEAMNEVLRMIDEGLKEREG